MCVVGQQDSFEDMHKMLMESGVRGGCTASVVYVEGPRCWVASAGDSRVCLVPGGGAELRRLTTDHRPSNKAEADAVRARGGFVTRLMGSNEPRVNAMLAVTRALGDRDLAEVLSCRPDVVEVDGFGTDHASATLVVACDGLWDFVPDDAVVRALGGAADERDAAETLRNTAFAQNSTDNITVIVVRPKNFVSS